MVSSLLIHIEEASDGEELIASIIEEDHGGTRQDALWSLLTYQYTKQKV
jgi:hypothetical protein